MCQAGVLHSGGEGEGEGEAEEDNEDVTTKEDAKPDSLVSAYWETIGTPAFLLVKTTDAHAATTDECIGNTKL